MGAKHSKQTKGGTYQLGTSPGTWNSKSQSKAKFGFRFGKPKSKENKKASRVVAPAYPRAVETHDIYGQQSTEHDSYEGGYHLTPPSSIYDHHHASETSSSPPVNKQPVRQHHAPSKQPTKGARTPDKQSVKHKHTLNNKQPSKPIKHTHTLNNSGPIIVNGQRFYRPGEPGHPAYRPTSAAFMRKYGKGQNALEKWRPQPNSTTHTGFSLTSNSTGALQASLSDVINGSTKISLDDWTEEGEHEGGEAQEEGQQPPMKFYRPGDPDHPSVRPTSSGFRRRYRAQAELAEMQRQVIWYD